MMLGMDIVIGMKLIWLISYNLNGARDGYNNRNESDTTGNLQP